MKDNKSLKCMYFLVLTCMFCLFTIGTANAKSNIKTVKKFIVVMEGATRELSDYEEAGEKIKVGNKKIATFMKNKPYSGVSRENNGVYLTLLKGVKAGKTTITITRKKERVVYKVTVYSKKSIQEKAKKALSAYKKKYEKLETFAYVDFNGDGVKEIYHAGAFTYYNYAMKKVVTKNLSMKKASTLYISPKKKLMFEVLKSPIEIKDNRMSRTVYGKFYYFNEEKVFHPYDSGVAVSKYKYPQDYVPAKDYIKGKKYFFIDDSHYDQDDYWYEPFTKESVTTFIKKKMPGIKKIV